MSLGKVFSDDPEVGCHSSFIFLSPTLCILLFYWFIWLFLFSIIYSAFWSEKMEVFNLEFNAHVAFSPLAEIPLDPSTFEKWFAPMYCHMNQTMINEPLFHQLRARRALSLFKDVLLKGCYRCTKPMVIAPFWFSTKHLWIVIVPVWFSTKHLWIVIAPFWLWTDDFIIVSVKNSISQSINHTSLFFTLQPSTMEPSWRRFAPSPNAAAGPGLTPFTAPMTSPGEGCRYVTVTPSGGKKVFLKG